MRIWYRRPLFCVCACLMTGVTGSFWLFSAGAGGVLPYVLPLAAVLLLLAGGWLLCRRYRPDVTRTALRVGGLCLCLCAGLLCGGLTLRAQVRADSFESDPTLTLEADGEAGPVWRVTGEVRKLLVGGSQVTVYGLSVDSVNGQAVSSCRAVLSCAYTGNLTPGCRAEAVVRAVPLAEAAEGMAPTLVGDGYSVGLLSEDENDVTVLSEGNGSLRARTDALRRRLSARLNLAVGREGDGLPSALLLGERRYLTDEVQRDFRRAGTSHMLAVSGLHVTMLFGLFVYLLRLLTVPKKLRALLAALAAFGYLWLLGFPPSATRAVIMAGLVYLSWVWGAAPDPLTALGLAGACILLCQPWAAADTGLWMSFSASFGLITVMPVVSDYLKAKPLPRHAGRGQRLLRRVRRGVVWFISGLVTGLTAMSCSLWVTAPVFGSVSLWSPPATLLLSIPCGLLLVLSLFCLPLGGTWLGQTVLLPAVRLLCRVMTGGAAFISESRFAVLSLRSGAAAWVIPAMTICLLLLLCVNLPRSRRWTVLLPVVCGWVLLIGAAGLNTLLHGNEVTVTARATSAQSEAVVLTRGQEAVIVDMSDGSWTAMRTAADEAAAQGGTELSAVVLTHYHSRMPGTLYRLLRAQKVRALYLPVPETEDEYYLASSVLAQAEDAGVPAVLYRAGGAAEAGDALTLEDGLTLSLYRARLARSEQPVLLLSVRAGDESLLWCGGAVSESDLCCLADGLAAEADTVLFCAHGPLYKAAYALPDGCAPSVVCFADDTAAAWFDTTSLPEDCPVLLIGGYRGRMKVK